ncbi:fructose-bisphosphate aldolase [Frondihabitans sucicola]|uniref:Fructose-bisphosphate aldolase n=1 Tax=Frondihabitans sucicola TaxID=1268041 RepID=A0ABM8GMW6_9MICO|nr:class II fructose-bisphosphate aldolase [Frondihabitans sucicola]BDZ49780.1 fructose-bisphosphate aldolase [Frondihabitans sucicola]
MTRAGAAELVAAAVAGRTAVPSFNVIGLEHAEGIVLGAERAGTSVLLQISENAIAFHGGKLRPLVAACRELADAAEVAIGIHLDHIEDAELIDEAVALGSAFGLGSIMVDASKQDYADNVATTADAARRARAAGLWVEAELGAIGGKDGAHAPGVRTDPAEAASFVEATGVDGLAVAVGSSHAMATRDAALDLDLVAALAAAVDVPLVLHGSSGVPDVLIRQAVEAGIRKINVGTALNLAYTSAVRAFLADDDRTSDPRKYQRPAREAVAVAVQSLCEVISPTVLTRKAVR